MSVVNNYFFDNIKYISKINKFTNILEYILTNNKELIIEKCKYFINIIEYIQIFHNIRFLKKEDVTSFGEFNFGDIKKIIWY